MVSAAAMVLVSNVLQQTYHPPEKNTPPPDRALKKKPSHANHMLTKIFSRSTTASRADSESVSEGTDDTIEFDELKGVIMPCPYINPLQHKLEPRIEQIRLRLPPTTSPSGRSGASDASLSPITIARHRGETNRLLTGRISDEDLDASIAKDAGASARFEKGEIPDSFDIVKLLDIDYVVKISAYDAITTVHWKEYLDCYIKVRLPLSSSRLILPWMGCMNLSIFQHLGPVQYNRSAYTSSKKPQIPISPSYLSAK
jgi:hypothetical protein